MTTGIIEKARRKLKDFVAGILQMWINFLAETAMIFRKGSNQSASLRPFFL
jgi:hypothetical protein